MDLFRYEAEKAQPLEGGANVSYIPITDGEALIAMVLHFDAKGDTGKREVPDRMMMIVTVGEGSVRSGGTIADVKAGDVLTLPGNRMHHIWTKADSMECVLVTI